jgi:hypothetical protein
MAGLNPVTGLPQAPESTFGICAPADEALLESCVLQPHYCVADPAERRPLFRSPS